MTSLATCRTRTVLFQRASSQREAVAAVAALSAVALKESAAKMGARDSCPPRAQRCFSSQRAELSAPIRACCSRAAANATLAAARGAERWFGSLLASPK